MLQHIGAVAGELAGRRVERDAHVLPGPVAGGLDARHERLERRLVRLQIGREATLVAHRRGEATLVQPAAERVEDLGAGAERLPEGARPHRHDHELLEVHLVVRMRAAVQHVHHRHREHVRGLAAQIAPEREPDLCRGGLRGRQRHPEDCVRSQPRLVRRAVELDHRAVHGRLIGCVEPVHAVGDLALHVVHCAANALAVPGRAAVAQLHRLELPGRGARGHRGTPRRAGGEHHIHLDRGIPATVHDLPPVHRLNLAHLPPLPRRRPPRKHLYVSAAARRLSSGSAPASTASRTAASRRSPGPSPAPGQS